MIRKHITLRLSQLMAKNIHYFRKNFKCISYEEVFGMLSARHEQQINELIGEKVKVIITFKSYTKVLRQDEKGLYIRFRNQRVTCNPDTNTLNILFFTALDPKYTYLKHRG